jgi:lysophospholipase L1-like esterase
VCKILPLGDSITFGIQYAGAYRVELFHDALMAKKNITFVGDPTLDNGPAMVDGVKFPQDNQGHSGWTISQIAGITPSPSLDQNPHIILLHIGTNDMYQTPAGAPDRLGMLIDTIVKTLPNSLLAVSSIIPYPSGASAVMTYNAAVPGVVMQRAMQGKHVIYVDQFTGFQTSTMLSSDGVHPNQTGYNHMGDVWYAAISSMLP